MGFPQAAIRQAAIFEVQWAWDVPALACPRYHRQQGRTTVDSIPTGWGELDYLRLQWRDKPGHFAIRPLTEEEREDYEKEKFMKHKRPRPTQPAAAIAAAAAAVAAPVATVAAPGNSVSEDEQQPADTGRALQGRERSRAVGCWGGHCGRSHRADIGNLRQLALAGAVDSAGHVGEHVV